MKMMWTEPSQYMAHRGPLHDKFCRCPDCKPPLVGARAAAFKIKVIVLATAIVLGAIVAYFQ